MIPKTKKLFISYAKKDTQPLAFDLCDLFNDIPNISAWVDRSLTAGRSWEGDIQREIRNCDAFIVLYSPDINRHLHDSSASESYVLEEIAYARYTCKKPIIPVMAQPTEPPMGMTRIQYIDFTSNGMTLTQLANAILSEAQLAPSMSIALPPPQKKPTSLSLMPPPFAWIEIPGGRGTMQTSNKNVILDIPTERYSISKYPITNAQYAKFIEDGGYENRNWWTDVGWKRRENENVTQPRFWADSTWNGADQPVVGVSWYEAVAFTLWLSDVTGETITLPTEAQWQYAAQGDDGREYPWGNNWDKQRCNSRESGIGKTTPVTQFEGVGDSPFGVVDMAGNIWEWTLTDYDELTNDPHSEARSRVLRGGSWSYFDFNARAVYRYYSDPYFRGDSYGFRVLRAPSQ